MNLKSLIHQQKPQQEQQQEQHNTNYQNSDSNSNKEVIINIDKENYITENLSAKQQREEAYQNSFKQNTKHLDSTADELIDDNFNIRLANEKEALVKNYNYRYQAVYPEHTHHHPVASSSSASTSKSSNFLQIKLKDLIDLNREKVFVDNLYAQFYSDSNLVNLVYVSPMEKAATALPVNSVQLDNHFMSMLKGSASTVNLSQSLNTTFANNLDANKLLNEFYLNAAIRRNATRK